MIRSRVCRKATAPRGTVMHLKSVRFHPDRYPTREYYPFQLDLFHKTAGLDFRTAVTLFVGENGTGKSTLLEARPVDHVLLQSALRDQGPLPARRAGDRPIAQDANRSARPLDPDEHRRPRPIPRRHALPDPPPVPAPRSTASTAPPSPRSPTKKPNTTRPTRRSWPTITNASRLLPRSS
jgi:hypothetical protein